MLSSSTICFGPSGEKKFIFTSQLKRTLQSRHRPLIFSGPEEKTNSTVASDGKRSSGDKEKCLNTTFRGFIYIYNMYIHLHRVHPYIHGVDVHTCTYSRSDEVNLLLSINTADVMKVDRWWIDAVSALIYSTDVCHPAFIVFN